MKKCFECEVTKDLQEHHVVPKSRGGTKTVTLCYECHMKAHGRSGKGLNHSRLTKEGLQQAKRKGVKLGTQNPKVLQGISRKGQANLERVYPHIREAQRQGLTSRSQIADYLNEQGVKPMRAERYTKDNISTLLRRVKKAVADGKFELASKQNENML